MVHGMPGTGAVPVAGGGAVSSPVLRVRAESLEDAASLPDSDVLAEDLRAALEQIEGVSGDLQVRRLVW